MIAAVQSGARRIEPVFVERVWGRDNLSPLYGTFDRRIGEVWFPVGEEFPILVKFLFTDERLSVQVHPDDKVARERENSRGKTEMWHILAAEPGAAIALGFHRNVSAEELRRSIQDKTIEQLLNWVPVAQGDTLFAPARTVHAIGAGIALCEIQQNSDITYRLYDYGRPRELHLDKALEVADLGTYEGRREFPVHCEHFTAELEKPAERITVQSASDYLLIGIAGEGALSGLPFRAGEVWYVSPGSDPVEIDPSPGLQFIHTHRGPASS